MAGTVANPHTLEMPGWSCYLSGLFLQRACEMVQGCWRLTMAAVGLTSLYWFGIQAAGREATISSIFEVLRTASVTLVSYPMHSMAVAAAGLIFVPVHMSRSKHSVFICWSRSWLLCFVPSKQADTIVCSSVSAFQSHRIQLEDECSSYMAAVMKWFQASGTQQQVLVPCDSRLTAPNRAQVGTKSSAFIGSHRVELSPRALAVDDAVVSKMLHSEPLLNAPSIRAWLRYLGQGQDHQGQAKPSNSVLSDGAVLSDNQQQLGAEACRSAEPHSTKPVTPALETCDLPQVVGDDLLSQFCEVVDAPNFSQVELPRESRAWGCPQALFGAADSRNQDSCWERIVDQSSFGFSLTSHRRPMRNGLFLYCSRAVFENATPAQVRSFYMDDQYKVSCDKSLLKWITLPPSRQSRDMSEAPALGAEDCFLFSRIDFPGPLAAREYTYARRVWGREQDAGCYCINKSCSHDATPKTSGVKVEDYASGYVIRPCATPTDCPSHPATELVIIYFEDSKVRAPGILNVAIRNGMWGSWHRMEGWFRDHVVLHSTPSAPNTPPTTAPCAAGSIVPFPLRLEDIEASAVVPFPLHLSDRSEDDDDDDEAMGAEHIEKIGGAAMHGANAQVTMALDAYQAQLCRLRIPHASMATNGSQIPAPHCVASPDSDCTTYTCQSPPAHLAQALSSLAHSSSLSSSQPSFRCPHQEGSSWSGEQRMGSSHHDMDSDIDDGATHYSDALSDVSVLDCDNHAFFTHFFRDHTLRSLCFSYPDAMYCDDVMHRGSFTLGVCPAVPSEWLPLLSAGVNWQQAGASGVGRMQRTFTKMFTMLRGDRCRRRRRWASLRRQVMKVAKFAAGVKIMEAVLTVKGSLDT